MSIFDLLFLLLVFCTLITVVVILIRLLRGRRRSAMRTLIALGIFLTVYLLIVAAVAISAPQKILAMGQDRCFDEMCFAATDVRAVSAVGAGAQQVRPNGRFYLVTIRMSNQGRGRAQIEAGVQVSLLDGKGNAYEVSPVGQRGFEATNHSNPPLKARLQPGERLNTVQVFDVPLSATGLALHIGHSGPGMFIIGDDEHPLHKPTLVRLRDSVL